MHVLDSSPDHSNRWGNNVYITSDMNHSGWDGKLNGNEQPVGVYYYTITV